MSILRSDNRLIVRIRNCFSGMWSVYYVRIILALVSLVAGTWSLGHMVEWLTNRRVRIIWYEGFTSIGSHRNLSWCLLCVHLLILGWPSKGLGATRIILRGAYELTSRFALSKNIAYWPMKLVVIKLGNVCNILIANIWAGWRIMNLVILGLIIWLLALENRAPIFSIVAV